MRLQKTGNFIVRRGISRAMRNLAAANLKEHNWKENEVVIRQKQPLAVSDNGWTVKCVFCVRSKGAREDDGDLRQVSTFETDANIRTIITELNDFRLLVRIVGGDLIAIGAKYHLKCLIEFAVTLENQRRIAKILMKTCVTPACLSSLQVMSKKKSILENSCLDGQSCTLYMKVAWRI